MHWNLFKQLQKEIHSGFFGPVNRQAPGFTAPLTPAQQKAGEAALGDVGGGRNKIQLRTDQGMVSDPGARRYERMPDKSGKLNFGDGNNYYFMDDAGRKFYEREEKARREFDAAYQSRQETSKPMKTIKKDVSTVPSSLLGDSLPGIDTSKKAGETKSKFDPSLGIKTEPAIEPVISKSPYGSLDTNRSKFKDVTSSNIRSLPVPPIPTTPTPTPIAQLPSGVRAFSDIPLSSFTPSDHLAKSSPKPKLPGKTKFGDLNIRAKKHKTLRSRPVYSDEMLPNYVG